MELQQNKQNSRELSSQLVSIMTTEHYNLQTGRAMTVSEANGRASLFVGAVSSGLIALALVAQLSHLGTAFFVFSLVVLPTLFLMGLITFRRVLQSGLADVTYARGINRIRHLYLEYAPQMQPYFILGSHDDEEIILQQESMLHTWVQSFFGMASMVAIITSVLAGSFLWHAVHPVRTPFVGMYRCGRNWIFGERCAAPDLSTRAMGAPGEKPSCQLSQTTNFIGPQILVFFLKA